MTRQIRSELLKLRTARSFIVMVGLGVGLAVLISVVTALKADYSHLSHGPSGAGHRADLDRLPGRLLHPDARCPDRDDRSTDTGASRPRCWWSRTDAGCSRRSWLRSAQSEALVAILTGGICLALGAAILPGRGFSLGLDGKLVAELLAGMAIAGALMAAIGVGIGAMIRQQTAAVVGILVYLLLLEPLVTSVAIKSLDRFSIGNALAQLTSTARVNRSRPRLRPGDGWTAARRVRGRAGAGRGDRYTDARHHRLAIRKGLRG